MWAELQKSFKNALLECDNAAASSVLGDGLAPDDRLAIYRHHVFDTLTNTLKCVYPVVCRLVDERFFAYAADQFIREYPPTGPCLFEYGASFAEFLSDFSPCRELIYLPDVARLEWSMHIAWHAEDAVPLDPKRLRGLTPSELASLVFVFDASVSYLTSPWPIEHIWRANQPDSDPAEGINLDQDGISYLEIRRVNDDVIFRSLEAGVFAWRAALAKRQPLNEALDRACAAAPNFNLTLALQMLFAEALAVDIVASSTT